MEKVVFITGGSSGIGKAAALRLKKAGYIVYAAARRVEKMEPLKEHGIFTLEVDVTSEESMARAVETVLREQGRIDVLVNNAGYGSYGAVEDVPLSEAKAQFDVNVFGLAGMTRLVLPHMREKGAGKIVNISSMAGKVYIPLGAWYHATKFAVEAISDCLRYELKEFGIDVVIIEPGAVKSEWRGIAMEKLKTASADTAYHRLAWETANFYLQLDEGSEPELIARTIQKAVEAKRPRTRYAVGLGSKPSIFIRKILPDRRIDALWRMIFRRAKKKAVKTHRAP